MAKTDETWRDLLDSVERSLESREAGHEHVEDDALWIELTRRVTVLAYPILVGRLRLSSADVADVVQQILARFQDLNEVRRLAATASPAAYLAIIIRNVGVDAVRLRAREEAALQQLSSVSPASVEVIPFTVEILDTLEGELQSLSDEEQRLLFLRFWKGLRFKQIGAELDLQPSAVATRMCRLLKKLRERFGRSQPPN